MRKGALLLLALVFAVAASTSADAGRAKRTAKPAPDPAIEAQKNSAAFLSDLLHPWAPTATMKEPKAPKAAKARKKKKKS
jgi:hypothetical protein